MVQTACTGDTLLASILTSSASGQTPKSKATKNDAPLSNSNDPRVLALTDLYRELHRPKSSLSSLATFSSRSAAPSPPAHRYTQGYNPI
jgi:hypothetical protein